MLHLECRRHDGLHLELVQRRGLHLQGWLWCRAEPVAYSFEQRTPAFLWWYGVRARVVHAWGGCLRRHDQVWRCYASGREDGGARCRSPRHRGVHRDQGPRRGQDPGSARRGIRHGPRWKRHHVGSVPERQQLGASLRRVHAGTGGGRGLRAAGSYRRRGCGDGERQGALPDHGGGRLGLRGSGNSVRRHHQRLAHQSGNRSDQRVQPLLGVHEPG